MAISMHATSVAIQLLPDHVGFTEDYIAEHTTVISTLAAYHFDEYMTQEDRKETKITELILCVQNINSETLTKKGVERGTIIACAVNKARHWIDAPPLHLTPSYLADQAEEIAKKYSLAFVRLNENQIINLGMGGLAAVSKGSDLDCQFLVMHYKTDKVNAQTLALVGKGITFDSGGLSLKPAQSMETMKDDMSGAAAVIATMEVLAQFKPRINVIGFVPISENLPSGKATKPGDVIRFYNGKTAEVKNTDAEGRLILADALSYAVKQYKPDAIVDIATLTGACAYALGPFYTGLMSQHDELVEKIKHAAQISGDNVWQLPMSDDYKKAIKSDIADICNIGDGRIKAGAITAAHFLQNFVEDTPWAHLDIAGTAFDVPHIPYYRSGATGVGVRLFVELAMNW
jgi:leucyl aminopeptidase